MSVDETPMMVRLSVTYRNDKYPTIKEHSFHQFLDYAPHFEIQQGLMEHYLDMPGAEFDIWHTEVEEPADQTHWLSTPYSN